jgi:hypothetical protein
MIGYVITERASQRSALHVSLPTTYEALVVLRRVQGKVVVANATADK